MIPFAPKLRRFGIAPKLRRFGIAQNGVVLSILGFFLKFF
jgi:hypothetical protein